MEVPQDYIAPSHNINHKLLLFTASYWCNKNINKWSCYRSPLATDVIKTDATVETGIQKGMQTIHTKIIYAPC